MSATKNIEVFGMGGAPCTQRVIQAALENDVAFDLKLVDLLKGEQKQPAHLARQPFGVIPTMDDNGFGLYESRAIARYVDETRGRHALTPKDPRAKALMEQWISLEQGAFTPEVGVIVKARVFGPMLGKAVDEAATAKAAEKLKLPIDVMEAHLAKHQFLAGDQFSLADVFFAPHWRLFVGTPEGKTLLASKPSINAWWKRCSERPSWVKTLTFDDLLANKSA